MRDSISHFRGEEFNLVAIDGRLQVVRITNSCRNQSENERSKSVRSNDNTSNHSLIVGKVFPRADKRDHVAHAAANAVESAVESHKKPEFFSETGKK